MGLLEVFVWIAAKLWLLAQWMLTRSIDAAGYALATFSLFPAYISISLNEAGCNWHQFFFYDIPWYLATIYSTAVSLKATAEDFYKDIIDKIDNADLYFTTTLPSSFEDTFGNLLGDLTQKDRMNIRTSFFVLLTIATIGYAIRHCEDQTVTLPSPTIAPKDNQDETKTGAQENDLGSLPNSAPFKPLKLVNLHTPGFFTNPRRTYSENRVTLSRPSYPHEAVIPAPIAEPENTRHPHVTVTQPVSQVEASTPPHDRMVLVSSPPEPLPPALFHDTSAAPQLPSIPPTLMEVCQGLSSRIGELKQVLDDFYQAVTGFGDVRNQIGILYAFVNVTYLDLKHYRDYLTTQESDCINWDGPIRMFWAAVYQEGHSLVYRYDSSNNYNDMRVLLVSVLEFGRFLNLNLPDLNMTPQLVQQHPSDPVSQRPSPRLPPPLNQQFPLAQPTQQPPLSAQTQQPLPVYALQTTFSASTQFATKSVFSTPSVSSFSVSNAVVSEPSSLNFQPAQTAAGHPVQRRSSGVPIDKARERYLMTAADPAGSDSPEERMNKLLKAKMDAGLLKPPTPAPKQEATSPIHQQASFRPVKQMRSRRTQSVAKTSSIPSSSAVTASAIAPKLPVAQSKTPKTAQASSSSAPNPQKKSGTTKLSMTDSRIDEWTRLSYEELVALKKEDWGWMRNTMLWRYDGKADLALDNDNTACKKTKHVAAELKGIATEFIRASVILRCQAKANDWHDCMDDGPELLQTIKNTLKTAHDMYKLCRGEVRIWDWSNALLFFHENVMEDDDVEEALAKHYGEDAWDSLSTMWDGWLKYVWLKAG